jgi:hypothetical protein
MHPKECKSSSELFTQEITRAALWKVLVSWTVSHKELPADPEDSLLGSTMPFVGLREIQGKEWT